MELLDPQLFSWSRWISGSPADFGVVCRSELLFSIAGELKKYAVGYCDAECLVCRPKKKHKAVMFFTDKHFWFHLRNEEFSTIFEVKDETR